MSNERGVLAWLRGLRAEPPALEPVQDVGPVWDGGPPPARRPAGPGEPFSVEALRRAWLAVRANGGAAGTDGVTLAQFEARLEEELARLAAALAEERYRPRPALRVLVPKRHGGLRPIALWTIRDRIVQRALYEALLPLCEPRFLPCSFGYRPGRGVAEAVAAVTAARDAGRRWVVDADIRQCFDHIRSDQVMLALGRWVKDRRLLRLTKRFLDARVLNGVSGGGEAAGTSQGSVLSPLLCNVYLHGFDEAIAGRPRTGRGAAAIEPGAVTLVRFADDFVVLAARKREAQTAHDLAVQALAALGLELHSTKTRVVHFDEGFKFLGRFFLRGEVYRL